MSPTKMPVMQWWKSTLLVCALGAITHAQILRVDRTGRGDYRTIDAAVRGAPEGATLLVYSGVFQGFTVDAKSLTEGEVHTINYRYHRWFVTNTHEGFTKMKVAEASDQRIRMQIIEDTSYTSNYINAHGTEINLKPIDANTTEVSLTIKYERLLDPAWYFDPLQHYAAGLLGEYLIEIMIDQPANQQG